MSEPIKPGDLVVVVHECCGAKNPPWLGKVFTVAEITTDLAKCAACGYIGSSGSALDGSITKSGKRKGVPLSWCKRIPPISEIEGERSEDAVPTPRMVKAAKRYKKLVKSV